MLRSYEGVQGRIGGIHGSYDRFVEQSETKQVKDNGSLIFACSRVLKSRGIFLRSMLVACGTGELEGEDTTVLNPYVGWLPVAISSLDMRYRLMIGNVDGHIDVIELD
jgi:hypothetical protein